MDKINAELNQTNEELLKAFKDITSKIDNIIYPKVQKTNIWVEKLKEYKRSHPGVTHKEAMIEVKKTYQKPIKVAKRIKSNNECQFCQKQFNNKSNLNRHMNKVHKANNPKDALLVLAKAKGVECKFRRILKGVIKDPKERIEFEEKHKKAIKTRDDADKIYKIAMKIIPIEVCNDVSNKVQEKVKKTNKVKIFIKELNKAYEYANNNKLDLSDDNIVKSIKVGDNIIITLKDMIDEDDEQIDQITIEKDDDGYNVSLQQKTYIKDKETMIDIDRFYCDNECYEKL